MQQLLKISTDLAPCVCRIQTPRCSGTGFIIGSVTDLSNPAIQHCFILTCFHLRIKEDLESGQACEAQFGYYESTRLPMARAQIMPNIFAFDDRLDYILLALEENNQFFNNYVNSSLPLKLGSLIRPIELKPKDPLIILGYPGSELTIDPAAYSMQRSLCEAHNLPQEYTFYQCSSLEGASGGPCVSKDGGVLHAIHLGGRWYEPRIQADPSNSFEYGVLLWHVLIHIKEHFVRDQSQGATAESYISNEGFYQLFPNFPR